MTDKYVEIVDDVMLYNLSLLDPWNMHCIVSDVVSFQVLRVKIMQFIYYLLFTISQM